MAAAELVVPRARIEAAVAAVRSQLGRRSAAQTLEECVLDAWEGLVERRRAECLLCGDVLEVSGCASCGARLE